MVTPITHGVFLADALRGDRHTAGEEMAAVMDFAIQNNRAAHTGTQCQCNNILTAAKISKLNLRQSGTVSVVFNGDLRVAFLLQTFC